MATARKELKVESYQISASWIATTVMRAHFKVNGMPGTYPLGILGWGCSNDLRQYA